MTVLETFWAELKKVNRYEFVSCSANHSKTQWQGKGGGQIVYESAGPLACYLREEGIFTIEGAADLDVSNEWLWQRSQHALALSHVRRGRDFPVLLFELKISDESSSLESVSPHLCGKDVYNASATLDGNGFAINWSIKGPRKDEQLAYTYYR